MNLVTKEANKIMQIMAKAPTRYQTLNFAETTLNQFKALIPDSIPDIIKEDIAYYFQYLNNNRSKKSLTQWEKATGCSDSPNSWKVEGYRPIFSYLYYDKITGGLFFPFLLKKIEVIANRPEKVSISEFNKLCRLSIVGFRPNIDSIDLKILQALSKNPSLVAQSISDTIDHSYATVYNHLQQLKAKMGLRITTRVNWAKLGVQRIFLISKDESLLNKFDPFKIFMDGQSVFLWGEVFHLRYYYMKEIHRNNLIEIYNTLPSEEQKLISVYEIVTAPIVGYNFDLYDLKEQRWDFDFAIKYLSIDSKKKVAIKELFLNNVLPTKQYKVTNLEIQIINGLVGNYDLPQKEIANLLGIHAPNLSLIKIELQNDNIIEPQLMVNTFLPLNLVLWCSSDEKEIIDILIYLISKMPFANLSPVKSLHSKGKYQLICFLTVDDILYSSLVTFLMQLLKDRKIDDFRLGLNIDYYFGMSKAESILGLEKEKND